MIDTQKMGAFTAEAMEQLEKSFPHAELGDVMIICELRWEDKEKDQAYTTIKYSCTDGRNHIHLGLLKAALKQAEK